MFLFLIIIKTIKIKKIYELIERKVYSSFEMRCNKINQLGLTLIWLNI